MRSKFEFILEIFREISSETSMNLEKKEKNIVFIVASYSLLFFFSSSTHDCHDIYLFYVCLCTHEMLDSSLGAMVVVLETMCNFTRC
jgi:hypothetical protein